MKAKLASAFGVSLLFCATTVGAASITGWDTTNVDVPAANPPDGTTGESVIFDRDPSASGAVTNGKIVYTPPEGVTPGVFVENNAFTFGPASSSATGCIRASAPTTCDGPRQSGKRFKQVATGFGPIDLVFAVDPAGDQDPGGDVDVGYRVFHRLINDNTTDRAARGFKVTLGSGIGDGFTKSSTNDGLQFSTKIAFGQSQVSSFSQYPFGLFGDADTNPNFDLDGFFDGNGRSGFNVVQTEDMISSAGFYGKYQTLFGGWLDQDTVPTGALWDNDNDDTTDALVMAWFDDTMSLWEVRRDVDPIDATKAISLDTPQFFTTFADVQTFLGVASLEQELIEDLANLNLNYGIALDDRFSGSDFTLRVELQVVPLPAGLPLMGAALAGLGFVARRRRG